MALIRRSTTVSSAGPIRWSEKGIFARIFEEPAGPPDPAQEVLTIDATHPKAHRTASSLAKEG